MPRVIIDNQPVDVVPGSNLLAAARKLGLDVPALCYHPGCTPNTSCMVCLVKVKDPDRFVPSCATLAADGMRVESETAEIHTLRRTVLELLLSDHDGAAAPDPGSPAGCEPHGCTKHDLCRLRKYAQMYAADPTRFRGVQRQLAGRAHEHPEITYDPRKCILCGICIQLAQQAGEPLGLTLGQGMENGEHLPTSLAAGTLEAVIAAIYIDGGLDAARAFIVRHMDGELVRATDSRHHYNFKSQLQQWAQRVMHATPLYELLDEKGPDHAKCFEVAVSIGGRQFPSAWGPTKKDAEQKAARLALITAEELGETAHDDTGLA